MIKSFLNQDDMEEGWNWYVYCGNGPIDYVDVSGESFEGDSFDPVYHFNWAKWWRSYWFNATSIPFRLLLGFVLKGVPGLITAAVLAGVSTAYLATSIVELWGLRIVVWWAYLFDEFPTDLKLDPFVGAAPGIGFYSKPLPNLRGRSSGR